jgi:hypothetical protein
VPKILAGYPAGKIGVASFFLCLNSDAEKYQFFVL